MDNTDNLFSYDNVESVQLSLKDNDLQAYLESKLESARFNLDFIRDTVLKGQNINRAIEIGGGNGKLLFALLNAGIIDIGENYEISRNRCELCKRFAKMLNSNISIHNENFLNNIDGEKADLIIGVDIVFQLVSPLYNDAENDALF